MHAFVLLALAAVASLVPVVRIWPVLCLVSLLGYGAAVAVVPRLRATFRPWRFGRVSGATILATGVVVAGSCAGLVAFHLFTRRGAGAHGSFPPGFTLGGIVAAGVVFSVFTALTEEVIFRGILFDSIAPRWGARVAIVATAVLYGSIHVRGYPPGALGAVLAGIYGVCLGWLRVFSGGLGLPVIAHMAADATIFTIFARFGV